MKTLLLLHAWRLSQLFPLPFKMAKATAVKRFPGGTGVLLKLFQERFALLLFRLQPLGVAAA